MSIDVLYKYGRLNENSEALFTTPTIWFSSPAKLNDPFECRPWFTFEGDRDQIVETISTILRRIYPYLTPNDATARAVGIVLEGRHRDPAIWEALRRNVVSMLGTNIGLCCLSANNDSILMWSHYADNHCGYCLGFEATDNTPFFGGAQQISYDDKFPTVDFFNTPHEQQVDLIFLTKFSGWRYEAEYRIIDHQEGAGLHSYPVELLRSVTFGLRMPEADRARIRTWVELRDHGIKFFEAVLNDRQFKIEVREVA